MALVTGLQFHAPMALTKSAMTKTDDADAEYRRFVGRNLEMARLMIDTNRARIAEDQYGISQTTWGRWEAGKRMPSEATLARFCLDWGFTMDFFYLRSLAGMDERRRRKLCRAYPELLDFREADIPLPPKPSLDTPLPRGPQPPALPTDWADDDYDAAGAGVTPKRRRPGRRFADVQHA